jgi:ribosomal protein L37E
MLKKSPKNKYDRESQKVLKIKCTRCGKEADVLEAYAHYWIEFKQMYPYATMICSECGVGEIKI